MFEYFFVHVVGNKLVCTYGNLDNKLSFIASCVAQNIVSKWGSLDIPLFICVQAHTCKYRLVPINEIDMLCITHVLLLILVVHTQVSE
jgi:hypothetical protein